MHRAGITSLFACLGLFVDAPASSADPVPLDPEALWSMGVLVWKYEVPEDLPEGEFDYFQWIVAASENSETVETGVSFKGIPLGAQVRIHLWIGDFLSTGLPRHKPNGIRYSMTWPEGTTLQKRFGVMKIPPGYDEWYGHLSAGKLLNLEIGSKLMLTKSGTKEGPMAFLDLVAGFEEPAPSEKKRQ